METRLQAIERRLKRGWIYMQPADVEELLSLLKECRGSMGALVSLLADNPCRFKEVESARQTLAKLE